MSAQHTPGPWRAQPWTSHAATTVMAGDVTVVADCGGSGQLLSDCEGDARLIAAAPELLAALQLAKREMSAMRASVGPGLLTDAAIAACDSAIAKATGAQL